jgi:hypothetical protein
MAMSRHRSVFNDDPMLVNVLGARVPYTFLLSRAVPLALCFNILPDYLSLALTRFFLHVMKNLRSPVLLLALLALASLSSAFIGNVVANEAASSFTVMPYSSRGDIRSEINLFLYSLYFPLGQVPLPNGVFLHSDAAVVWFYPALIGSIWLWLYIGADHDLQTKYRDAAEP